MAHPFSEHRQQAASKKRVGHIMKSGGMAHSDAAADKKLFNELMAKHEAKEMQVEGKLSHKRLDKYARGGKVGKYQDGGKTNPLADELTKSLGLDKPPPFPKPQIKPGQNKKFARGGRTKHKPSHQVNIAIVAPHGRHPTEGAAPGGPMPMLPPRPPIGGAPGLPPGLPPGGPPVAGGPPGLPPGLGPKPPGMMKRGGKVKGYARGGKLGMTAGAETGVGRKQKAHKYSAKG